MAIVTIRKNDAIYYFQCPSCKRANITPTSTKCIDCGAVVGWLPQEEPTMDDDYYFCSMCHKMVEASGMSACCCDTDFDEDRYQFEDDGSLD